MTKRRTWAVAALASLVGLGALVAGWVLAIDAIGVPPRRLASWIERHASRHGPTVVEGARWIARALLAADRGSWRFDDSQAKFDAGASDAGSAPTGASPDRGRPSANAPRISPGMPEIPAAPSIVVGSPGEVRDAIARAQPGDVITIAPGRYRFDGNPIDVSRPGRAEAPITIRAEVPGSVTLEFALAEGFVVSAPDWIFEGLVIRGVCADHSACEHAFHVVGHAVRFVARRNTVLDFNAQFKINGRGGAYPDEGRIEGNVIADTAPRRTANPVAPIDLVAASGWRITGNRISDFIKVGGDAISVGAFAKGGGTDNRFLGNLVICEDRLRELPGQRVGLSLGDGGTDEAFCRGGDCRVEQDGGVIASNLIASCSDDGIYVNRAARSRIAANVLIDTGGIVARAPETVVEVVGNRVDGAILARDGARLRAAGNQSTALPWLYLGWHPVRWRFEPPAPVADGLRRAGGR